MPTPDRSRGGRSALPLPVLRVGPPDQVRQRKLAEIAARLRPVLGDHVFPTERWRLVIEAESYGADLETRCALRSLPPRRFESVEDVIHELLNGYWRSVPIGPMPGRRG